MRSERPTTALTSPAVSLSYQRISKAIGATVTGFQPQLLSNPGALDDMYSALIEHQLLVIPNARLSPAGLQRLGSAFGPVTNDHHAYQSHPDADAVVVLEWGGPNRPDAAECTVGDGASDVGDPARDDVGADHAERDAGDEAGD